MSQPLDKTEPPFEFTPEFFGLKPACVPPAMSLCIAYEAPKRPIQRVLLLATGTADSGYDDIAVIRDDHIGSFGFHDVGVHIYVNEKGVLQWGRSLEKTPEFPSNAHPNDLVILIHGLENSLEINALRTLRELLPVINAIHGNKLRFEGLAKHHARLGIDHRGKLVDPALQAPPEHN